MPANFNTDPGYEKIPLCNKFDKTEALAQTYGGRALTIRLLETAEIYLIIRFISAMKPQSN